MNILCHCFDSAADEDKEILGKFFASCDYHGAGYTYLANLIWKDSYCICWEQFGDYLIIAGSDCMRADSDIVISMPLTADGRYDPQRLRESILACKARFDDAGVPFVITRIPEHLKSVMRDAFPGGIELVHDRDDDEYVYLKEKLIELSGRALHKKKNHLNFFLRTYEYEVKPVTSDMRKDIEALTARIKESKEYDPEETDSLESEYKAIDAIIDHLEDEKVYSAAIFIKGRLEAFAIGERSSDDTAIEHFEKANDDYRGLYQLVCREFCKVLPQEVIYVNREEDMGLENLRQAKEALKPDHMEVKYTARLTGVTVQL